ncbi:MAG: glutamate--tRNA ligase [Brevinemataceae bacterium]
MIRTRFAPSPTGYIHVGNVRSAFFGWLFARSQQGKFIVRIEDTDQERSKPEYTEFLLNDMEWLGLDWDEGPRVGGEFGPYFQTQRMDIYQKYAQTLLQNGCAFKCYCTEEELEKDRTYAEQNSITPHYTGRCRNLTLEQQKALEAKGRLPVIRFKAYQEDFVLHDLIKGDVVFPKGMVGDFVIMRASGVPVYNFAVVIDDITMEITHVFRADEHLSNTVRQQMIYKALNIPEPKFGHMALVLGEDRKKLSKRHGATSIEEFRRLGYLPESLCNLLALLGWSSPTSEEILSKEELIKLFDINRVSASPSIFDFQKLNWISRHNIISADLARITNICRPFLEAKNYNLDDEKYLQSVIEVVRGNCNHLSEITDFADYFFTDNYEVDQESSELLKTPEAQAVILSFKNALNNEQKPIDQHVYKELTSIVKNETGFSGKKLFMPIRAALTGKAHGPEMFLILPILGKQRSLERLSRR